MDVMILVDMGEPDILDRGKGLSEITLECGFAYELTIMPIVKNIDHFNKWLRAYPIYYNVKKRGSGVIEELLNLAKQMAAVQKEGDKLGFIADELAFYYAPTKSQPIKVFIKMKNW